MLDITKDIVVNFYVAYIEVPTNSKV